MFAVLVESRETMTRQRLGETAGMGPDGGAFGDYLSLLRRNGLIEEPSRSEVMASPALYLGDPGNG